jgi:hypothetical protein
VVEAAVAEVEEVEEEVEEEEEEEFRGWRLLVDSGSSSPSSSCRPLFQNSLLHGFQRFGK